VVDSSPVYFVTPKEGKLQQVYDQLHGAHANMSVYFRENTPERWHFRNNRRISPIVAVADDGWSIAQSDYFSQHPNYYNGGGHGYDNEVANVRSIFIASGPDFAKGKIVREFPNINVYATLCKILRLTPAPNNGTVVREVLSHN